MKKDITHFTVLAYSPHGVEVQWGKVDSFGPSDNGDHLILRDADKGVIGAIPGGWVIKMTPRSGKDKLQ